MELVTARLVLREFRAGDWPAVLAYQSDPLYLRYTPWTGRTPEAVQAFVETFLGWQQEIPRARFQLAVTHSSTGELIGNCGIRISRPAMQDAGSHEADIGYEFAPAHWGQVYATEAARAIVAYGFTELRVHRISAWSIAENAASAHVLEKLGMTLEGRLRHKVRFKGRWWDTLLYALLEHEWRDQKTEG